MRVVLNILGAEDYGIYNVTTGIVTMFGFLSISMAGASQRYFAFEIGRNNFEQLKKIFSLNFTIYILLSIVILVFAETIGLWFVNNKLIIPPDRKNTVMWIYQFSVISFLFTFLTIPYMASIIAHEEMNIYAYVSIFEVLLKLVVVFLLQFISYDKLKLYGFLICFVTIVNTVIYRLICRSRFQECRFSFYWNKELFKEIANFIGWNLFSTIASVLKNQGINILLNQFFNPVIVASRSISVSIGYVIGSFSENFNTALKSQITKYYATGQKTEMMLIMFSGIKLAFFLMYIFILPLMLEMSTVLTLWLKNPPEYLTLFTRLELIVIFINTFNYQTRVAILATGKIKLYQSLCGGILLLNLPVSWIILLMGFPIYFVIIIAICLTFIVVIIHLCMLKRLINSFSIKLFLENVILPLCMVLIISAILPVLLNVLLKSSFLRLCLVSGVSVISVCGSMYMIGLNKKEREKIISIISNSISKKWG
jgi:O-antigen/teichoic acid export membrane protein